MQALSRKKMKKDWSGVPGYAKERLSNSIVLFGAKARASPRITAHHFCWRIAI
jgi:hypothetical protein